MSTFALLSIHPHYPSPALFHHLKRNSMLTKWLSVPFYLQLLVTVLSVSVNLTIPDNWYKDNYPAGYRRLTPVILASWEAEIRVVPCWSRENCSWDLILMEKSWVQWCTCHPHGNHKTGRSQSGWPEQKVWLKQYRACLASEFKSQYCWVGKKKITIQYLSFCFWLTPHLFKVHLCCIIYQNFILFSKQNMYTLHFACLSLDTHSGFIYLDCCE
jgi:hypothetical protein